MLTELREKHVGKGRESAGEGEYTYATVPAPDTSAGQELEMSRVAELKWLNMYPDLIHAALGILTVNNGCIRVPVFRIWN